MRRFTIATAAALITCFAVAQTTVQNPSSSEQETMTHLKEQLPADSVTLMRGADGSDYLVELDAEHAQPIWDFVARDALANDTNPGQASVLIVNRDGTILTAISRKETGETVRREEAINDRNTLPGRGITAFADQSPINHEDYISFDTSHLITAAPSHVVSVDSYAIRPTIGGVEQYIYTTTITNTSAAVIPSETLTLEATIPQYLHYLPGSATNPDLHWHEQGTVTEFTAGSDTIHWLVTAELQPEESLTFEHRVNAEPNVPRAPTRMPGAQQSPRTPSRTWGAECTSYQHGNTSGVRCRSW